MEEQPSSEYEQEGSTIIVANDKFVLYRDHSDLHGEGGVQRYDCADCNRHQSLSSGVESKLKKGRGTMLPGCLNSSCIMALLLWTTRPVLWQSPASYLQLKAWSHVPLAFVF